MVTVPPQFQKTIHEHASELYARGELAEAAAELSTAIGEGESAELWSDWGAVQAALGAAEDAERAFRRALRMDATWREAAENLGVLLYAQGRLSDAGIYLEQALALQSEGEAGEISRDIKRKSQRKVLQRMLEQCAPFCGDSGLPETAITPTHRAVQDCKAQEQAAAIDECDGNSDSQKHGSDNLKADGRKAAAALTEAKNDAAYDEWCVSVFGQVIPVPGVRIGVSWAEDSSWGLRAYNALAALECEYALELLREIAAKNIPGDLAEFGIYEGWWINYLWQATERVGLQRRIYGFDSFEGLSEPHAEHDQAFWKKGQYACALEQVRRNVKSDERPRLKLVKGFFEKSLRSAEALLPEQFCYARIDCDIYQPALECLQYLGPRLVDGAIVVFDDWPHVRGFGEQLALERWLPTVPHLKFEFLFYGAIGHFYTRVHHRK
jgi:tetratricopeptide (TPR) repeat protein